MVFNTTIINSGWPEHDPSSTLIADDVLELEDNGGRRSSIWPTHLVDQGSIVIMNEYHMTTTNYAFGFDFWMVAISRNTLQQVARNKFAYYKF